MNEVSQQIQLDNDSLRQIFGTNDSFIKKLEKDFKVDVIDRNGAVTVRGEGKNVKGAVSVLTQLNLYTLHGNDIEEQNVD